MEPYVKECMTEHEKLRRVTKRALLQLEYPSIHYVAVAIVDLDGEQTMLEGGFASFWFDRIFEGLVEKELCLLQYRIEVHNEILSYHGMLTRISDSKNWSF